MSEETTTYSTDITTSVKILEKTEEVAVIAGYGVVFGGVDLEGETFTKSTDYQLDMVPVKSVYFDHSLDDAVDWQVGTTTKNELDEIGIWVEAQIDRSKQYNEAVLQLVEAGALGWSSGSVTHLARREGKTITKWPVIEFSLTPIPAEPRTVGVERIKQLAEANPDLKALLPEIGQETDSADATERDANADVSEIVVEEKNMSEKQDVPVLTAEAIGEAVGTQIKSSLEPITEKFEELEKEVKALQPELKTGGVNVEVIEDEDDRAARENPFKSFGDFLQTVATDSRDTRLRPTKSEGVGLKGNYFDVTKAMGHEFVGSLTETSMKAPTGLQEGIPSAGGFLVGQDRNASLLARVYDIGNVLNRTDMIGIGENSNGMTFYAEDETSRADGSRRGGIRAYWAAEAEEKTASKPKFREMELKLRKLVALCYATDELLADATALESWIMGAFPEEVNFVAEDAIFNGTGVGMPLGILNSGAAVSVAKETGQAAATIVAENIDNMWARRYIRGRNYVWFVNQDTSPQLARLNRAVGTGGELVYSPPGGISQAPFASLKGVPVIETEYSATLGTVGDIVLADLGEYQVIDKGGIESASSIHVRFVYDESVFRFVYRIDGEPKWNAPLTPFKGTNTVSPFVTLATRA